MPQITKGNSELLYLQTFKVYEVYRDHNFSSNHLPPKVSPLRMKLAHASMTHIPSSIIKIIINFVETPS